MVHPLPNTHAKPHLVQSTEQVLPTAMIRYMVVALARYSDSGYRTGSGPPGYIYSWHGTSPTNYNDPIHGSGAGEIYSVVQGTEQVLPTAMIRYMVVVLGDSLPPHEHC